MAKSKFSHLRMTPGMLVEATERGHRVADEDLIEVISRIEPPLLPVKFLSALIDLLDPEVESRGRRKGSLPTKREIVAQLKSTSRPDLAEDFIGLLTRRLERGKPYSRADFDARDLKRRNRQFRDMFISGLYKEFYELLGEDTVVVEHPILGEVQVPDPVKFPTKSLRALEMAGRCVANRPGMHPPSAQTMLNEISRRRNSKKRPKK